MNHIEELQDRVESAVKNLQRSQKERREYNHSLGQVLNDLEGKFEARTAELDHCRQRIAQLEDSNSKLTTLVGQLVDIVERIAHEADEDPVFRATGTATDLVERYVRNSGAPAVGAGPVAAADPPAAEPHDIPAPPDEAPPVSISPQDALDAAGARFEDVGAETLASEAAAEEANGATEFPRLVYDAIALSRGAESASATVDTDGFELEAEEAIEIPEPGAARPSSAEAEDDKELDIKEIMARLEIAAERAQLRGRGASDQRAAGGPAMDRAVGGSA